MPEILCDFDGEVMTLQKSWDISGGQLKNQDGKLAPAVLIKMSVYKCSRGHIKRVATKLA